VQSRSCKQRKVFPALRRLPFSLLLVCLVVSDPMPAQTNNTTGKIYAPDGNMYLGVAYYPEHWPEQRWEQDLQLMKQAGFNVVRLAEFSWALMEPSEGKYDFSWLDRFLNRLTDFQMSAILGTPTAAMPAWLAHQYPHVLIQTADGAKTSWGSRQQNNFTSPDFLRLANGVVRAMANHYKNHPAVVGWQIDNELWGPYDFSSATLSAFQQWLKQKYQTLEKLNAAWGAHFWGNQLTHWRQITIPDCEGAAFWDVRGNPSACLDWNQFHSHLLVSFLSSQAAIIKSTVSPKHFVTHNFMAQSTPVDYFRLAAPLDLVSLDNYPVWYGPRINYLSAFTADLMRGLKSGNFLVMEQQAGAAGWGVFHRNPRPGEIRLIACQMLARGADGQLWFRWRTSTAGREQYWHGVLGHDGIPGRRYEEIKQTVSEFRQLQAVLKGTTVKAEAAILYDYATAWSLKSQPGYEGNTYEAALLRYYNALFRAGVNVDVIHADADFSGYKLLIAPHLVVLPDHRAHRLNRFVENGGVLLADCRTGVMNENNLAHARTLPGLLSNTLGISIPEYEAITEDFSYIVQNSTANQTFTAHRYGDWIAPTTAAVRFRYREPHLQPYAAVTRNTWQQGIGWYVGAVVKEEIFYDTLMRQVLHDARISTFVNLPNGVEAVVRQSESKRILFLMNHSTEEKVVDAIPGQRDLLNGLPAPPRIVLPAFGVAVMELNR
jgi:beta-galactosidase